MGTPWIAVGVTLPIALASGTSILSAGTTIAPTAMPAVQTIHIRAHIDGRSRLILDDDTAQWQHFNHAAPGRIRCNSGNPIQATYIDGLEWWPEWPDIPNCENRGCGGCYSDIKSGLPQTIPDTERIASIIPIAVRGTCSIIEHPNAANGYRVVVEFNDNPTGGAAWYEVELVLQASTSAVYCLSLPNSTGRTATLGVLGSQSIAANDTYLRALSCPPGCMGVFFYGAETLKMPFANGYLCINAFGPGLYRISPTACAGPSGEAQVHLDFPSLPPGGGIVPGSTRYFQYWFRDPAGGGARANLSHGLRLTFLP